MAGTEQPRDWIEYSELVDFLAMSRGTITKLRADPDEDFPQPIKSNMRKLRWHRDEVEYYRRLGKVWRKQYTRDKLN